MMDVGEALAILMVMVVRLEIAAEFGFLIVLPFWVIGIF